MEAKAPELAPVLEAAKIDTATNQPKRPREEVKINNLNSGSAAPATVVAPVNKVQTGGFGDPNGVPGNGDPNKSTNINRKGSPALPGGPGYGNGTGGDKGIRGTVASTGFGNGTANPPQGGGRKGCRAIHRLCRSIRGDRRLPRKKLTQRPAARRQLPFSKNPVPNTPPKAAV